MTGQGFATAACIVSSTSSAAASRASGEKLCFTCTRPSCCLASGQQGAAQTQGKFLQTRDSSVLFEASTAPYGFCCRTLAEQHPWHTAAWRPSYPSHYRGLAPTKGIPLSDAGAPTEHAQRGQDWISARPRRRPPATSPGSAVRCALWSGRPSTHGACLAPHRTQCHRHLCNPARSLCLPGPGSWTYGEPLHPAGTC